MAKAIEQIANSLVRAQNRAELERLRDHRARMVHDYRLRPFHAIRSESLETSLEDDIKVLDEALSRLSI